MRSTKANIAGVTYPLQQAEMKSILAGTWPPLKPLPVFKYETAEYRATIDFDKKRGEWVCRKTSLASNKVQELRGGLRAIALASPHAEAEMFTEGAEQQEHELEKDANRRLQAIREWKENYENGALYFELRDYLSESQRAEIDDSLRLSLTARQLQFNSKNVAYVFDALSTAGGRLATLIELAKRNMAKHGADPQAQGEGAVPEAECAIDHDQQALAISSREFGGVLDTPVVRDQEAAQRCTDVEEFPAVSIKDISPEQERASLAEPLAQTAAQQFEIEASEIVEGDSPSLVEHLHQEGHHHAPAFAGFAPQVRTDQSSADRIEGSSSRFPALELSAFQVVVFALLFLFAVIAFTVGLTVGRGPLGSRFQKSMLAIDAKSAALPGQAESTSPTPTSPAAGSDDSTGTNKLDDGTGSEDKSKEIGAESFAEAHSMDSDSFPTMESKPSAKPEVNPEGAVAIGGAPRSPAPYRLTPTISAAPHLPRPSAMLVTVPGQESPPFRVSFPEKAITATSSFAMTSQLSVLVSSEPGPTVAHKPYRLEAGELVSFAWPRYPRPRDRYGLAETIRVRATIGQLGQVLGVKFLSGSVSLLPATVRAIRQWRYRPTLLDKKPVPAQQDVTIEFRPSQYSSQVSTPHPSHHH
jgi:periplasmic protein TonB